MEHKETKDITICFRTSEEVRKPLDAAARKARRSLSAMIEEILREHVKGQNLYSPDGPERRRFPRKAVSIPALVTAPGLKLVGPHPGVIIDMSLSGLRISVPKESGLQAWEDAEGIHLHILFSLPPSTSVSTKCKPCRVRDAVGEIEIGASITDCDLRSYQSLHSYLQ
jgi:hypothetical protein